MFHNFQWGSTWRREYEGRRPSSGRRRGGRVGWQPLEESKVPGLLDDDHQVNLICGILFSYFGNVSASGHTCFSYSDAFPFAYSYSDTFLSFLDPRHHLNFAYLHINHHQSQQSQYIFYTPLSFLQNYVNIFPSPVSRRRWPTRPLWLWLLSRVLQAASLSASVKLLGK